MDRTTWVDPAVVEAVGRCALTIQVDVDADAAISERLQIRAMPTVIAFRGGAEIDRVVGLRRPEQMLAWLDGLERGETASQQIRAHVSANPTDVEARRSLARALLDAGQLDEATTEYVWLWQHMLEHRPSMYGVRHSFFVSDLARLVSRHAPAREVLARLREAVAPVTVGGSPTPPAAEVRPVYDALKDWFSLNEALGEEHASLRWYDSLGGQRVWEGKLAWLLQRHLAPLLIEADRWAELASLYPAPVETLKEDAELHAEVRQRMAARDVPPDEAKEQDEYAARSLRDTARKLVRALRAAGRAAEADEVQAEARRLDPSAEMEAALAGA
jgi:hypothetical protein